jgi:hypothetical protein
MLVQFIFLIALLQVSHLKLVIIFGNILVMRHRSQVLPWINIASGPQKCLSAAFDALQG